MYEKFDTNTMTGQTKRDKMAIRAALDRNKMLYINDKFQVTTETGQHIANGLILLPGQGLEHEKQ